MFPSVFATTISYVFPLNMTGCANSNIPVAISTPWTSTSLLYRSNQSPSGVLNHKATAAALQTEGAEAFQAFPEGSIGETVDETVTEAVADGQPCGEERRSRVMVDPRTLQ